MASYDRKIIVRKFANITFSKNFWYHEKPQEPTEFWIIQEYVKSP